ncbi:phage tail sheath C-terminal domain-containing protein [Actinoplanes sp. NPDC026619]|uniref:phage tail sheath family protein n=1 Tax=Actinoplanes sp. NPDC026619 TaxID=3155798 RepID=UPI0033FB3BD8
MPVTPTYPGLYIEEVLSNSHTITAAPTSVAVFVGYTHPFKTRPQHYGEAVQIFSFTDYEREFGGLFSVGWLADDVGRAVFQFFANGGSVAWIVALLPAFHLTAGTTSAIAAPTLGFGTAPNTFTFTGREPVDAQHPMTVTLSNLAASVVGGALDVADLTVAYGTRTETYRQVSLAGAAGVNSPENRLGTTAVPVSSMVTVARTGTVAAWPAAPASGVPLPVPLAGNLPATPFTTFLPGDFGGAFATDGALDKVTVFNLLLTPGIWDPAVVGTALAFAERKHAFVLVDPPPDVGADQTSNLPLVADLMTDALFPRRIPKSENGALYFPYLVTSDPATGAPLTVAPSGSVAGVIAREDNDRGVWKAPAGLEALVQNVAGVVPGGRMTDPRQGTLNPIGVNCLRSFPGVGTVVFGARTLVAGNPALQQFRYVPVRRMTLFLEQSLLASLGWVIFEPNDSPLWVSIKTTIDGFMTGLFTLGAFQGATPSQAFQVRCDASTTTPDDQANGIVNIVVAFAPLKPAEFVIIKIAQLAGQTQS